jgi:hypothetical protein
MSKHFGEVIEVSYVDRWRSSPLLAKLNPLIESLGRAAGSRWIRNGATVLRPRVSTPSGRVAVPNVAWEARPGGPEPENEPQREARAQARPTAKIKKISGNTRKALQTSIFGSRTSLGFIYNDNAPQVRSQKRPR